MQMGFDVQPHLEDTRYSYANTWVFRGDLTIPTGFGELAQFTKPAFRCVCTRLPVWRYCIKVGQFERHRPHTGPIHC
jgi:hypothetical protein